MLKEDKKIKISVTTTEGIAHRIENHLKELESTYSVEHKTLFRFSSNQLPEYINLIVETGNYISEWAKEEVLELFIGASVIKPLLKWLEGIETGLDISSPKEITYKFIDVEIKIGFSKKNHLHAIALLCQKVNEIKLILDKSGLKTLTLVASPLQKKENSWFLYSPNDDFVLESFLDYIGLELNGNNRCVLSKKEKDVIMENWIG